MIHSGVIIMMSNTITPSGFKFKDLIKSPFKRNNTERVDPQEGQGTFVTCLNKQKLPLRLLTE